MIFDSHVLAFDIAGLLQALAEGAQTISTRVRQMAMEESDDRHRRLLRARHNGPRGRRAAEKREELTPPQVEHGISPSHAVPDHTASEHRRQAVCRVSSLPRECQGPWGKPGGLREKSAGYFSTMRSLCALRASGGFLESCRPRHIERPVRHPARSSAPGPSVEILAVAGYSPRRSSNANSLCCAFSANSANIPAAARADFYPDGFRSSRLICPGQPVQSPSTTM